MNDKSEFTLSVARDYTLINYTKNEIHPNNIYLRKHMRYYIQKAEKKEYQHKSI